MNWSQLLGSSTLDRGWGPLDERRCCHRSTSTRKGRRSDGSGRPSFASTLRWWATRRSSTRSMTTSASANLEQVVKHAEKRSASISSCQRQADSHRPTIRVLRRGYGAASNSPSIRFACPARGYRRVLRRRGRFRRRSHPRQRAPLAHRSSDQPHRSMTSGNRYSLIASAAGSPELPASSIIARSTSREGSGILADDNIPQSR